MGPRFTTRRASDLDGLPGVPILVYDADCAFCTTSAQWLEDRFSDPSACIAPWQSLQLEPLGLTVDDVTRAAWWIDAEGNAVAAHLAIAAALRAGRRAWPFVGALIGHPPMSWVAAPVYRWVARHRQRMPGGSDACAIPAATDPARQTTPAPDGAPGSDPVRVPASSAAEVARARIVTFGFVALILAVSFAGLELWPLSGFRLFSIVRTPEQVSWQLRAVDATGAETTMDPTRLPPYDSGSLQVTQQLSTMPVPQQQAIMAAWMHGLGMDPDRYSSVRVYRVDGQVPTRSPEPQETPPVTEVLEVPLP